jgi:TetR/AcrR family transcriptional regulator, repressor for divergent bdcA
LTKTTPSPSADIVVSCAEATEEKAVSETAARRAFISRFLFDRVLAKAAEALYVSIDMIILPRLSMTKVSTDTKISRGRPARLNRTEGAAIAEPLFHRDGYDHLGVAMICDALGVRQPALYRVFGSKAGLFAAALERYATGAFATFVADEIGRATAPSDLTRNVLLRAADIYAGDPGPYGCLALETAYGSVDGDARRAAMALVDETRAALAERFAALGANDAKAHANAVLLAMRGLSSEARAGRSAADLRRAVEVLVKQ